MFYIASNSLKQHWNLIWFQVGIGHFCHLSDNWELLFIGTIFTIFENIPWKITKFPSHCRITHLCSLNISQKILKTNNGKVACATLYRISSKIYNPPKTAVYEVMSTFFTSMTSIICLLLRGVIEIKKVDTTSYMAVRISKIYFQVGYKFFSNGLI